LLLGAIGGFTFMAYNNGKIVGEVVKNLKSELVKDINQV
jgi:hypothetical protein